MSEHTEDLRSRGRFYLEIGRPLSGSMSGKVMWRLSPSGKFVPEPLCSCKSPRIQDPISFKFAGDLVTPDSIVSVPENTFVLEYDRGWAITVVRLHGQCLADQNYRVDLACTRAGVYNSTHLKHLPPVCIDFIHLDSAPPTIAPSRLSAGECRRLRTRYT
ncbi:hypothetical protein BD779DRAFT_1679151 [Infundibulicybe gibba]|nr:hypothetical protein BD779DRAFT_1679151 [Infundibulicybe gibba]